MQGKTTVNGGDRSSRFKRKSEPGLHHVRRSRAVRCTVSRSTGVSSAIIHSLIHSFKRSAAVTGPSSPVPVPKDTTHEFCSAQRGGFQGRRGLSATAAPRTAARWLSRLTCEPQERPLLRGAREPTALSTAGGERHDPVFRGPSRARRVPAAAPRVTLSCRPATGAAPDTKRGFAGWFSVPNSQICSER